MAGSLPPTKPKGPTVADELHRLMEHLAEAVGRDHVWFIVAPWWRRPLESDLAHRRAPLRYRVVRKPIGADWSATEVVSAHWTWSDAFAAFRRERSR